MQQALASGEKNERYHSLLGSFGDRETSYEGISCGRFRRSEREQRERGKSCFGANTFIYAQQSGLRLIGQSGLWRHAASGPNQDLAFVTCRVWLLLAIQNFHEAGPGEYMLATHDHREIQKIFGGRRKLVRVYVTDARIEIMPTSSQPQPTKSKSRRVHTPPLAEASPSPPSPPFFLFSFSFFWCVVQNLLSLAFTRRKENENKSGDQHRKIARISY